jgi:hypothetical protein
VIQTSGILMTEIYLSQRCYNSKAWQVISSREKRCKLWNQISQNKISIIIRLQKQDMYMLHASLIVTCRLKRNRVVA